MSSEVTCRNRKVRNCESRSELRRKKSLLANVVQYILELVASSSLYNVVLCTSYSTKKNV